MGRSNSILDALDVQHLDPADWMFIDYGSGLGRIVLLAAAVGFRSSLGIEAQPGPHRRALRNHAKCLERRGELSHCCLVVSDAREFAAPSEPLFCYAFSAFNKEIRTAELADRRRARRAGGKQIVLCTNPPHHGLIDNDPDAIFAISDRGWKAWRFQ